MYIIFTTSSASLTTCDSLATNYSISECHLLCAKLSCLCVCVCVCDERDRGAELQRRGEHVMWERINKRIISFSLHFAHSLYCCRYSFIPNQSCKTVGENHCLSFSASFSSIPQYLERTSKFTLLHMIETSLKLTEMIQMEK